MKNLIKLFSLLSLFTIFTLGIQAQTNITASAIVAGGLTISGDAGLDFNTVAPGVTKTIGTDDAVLQGSATGSETAGEFNVTKGANTTVTFTLTLPTELTFNAETMPINFADYNANQLGLWTITAGGADVTAFTPATGDILIGAITGGFAATGIKLELGGTVVPDPAQAAGTYTGTISLSAVYN